MNTKTHKLFLSVGLIFIINACDPQPTDFVTPANYYNNIEQLSYALNGVYNTLGSYGLYQYTYLCQIGTEADEGFYNRSTMTQGPQVYNFTSSNQQVQVVWQNLYIGIENANLLLENINKAKDIDEQKRGAIKGQALFLRAYYYFLLAINWGDVPLILTSTKSANYEKTQRTPVKDIYEQIVKDMTEAEGLVDSAEDTGFGGRVSKSVVQGILARVCLHMAGEPVKDVSKFEDAKKWAEKVINSGLHELEPNYEQIFKNYAQDKYNVKESIWEVEFWGNATDSYREYGHVGNVLGISAPRDSPFGSSTALINVTYYHYLKYDEGDLRRDWNCAPYRYDRNTTNKIYWGPSHLYNRNVGKYRREFETLLPKLSYGTPQNFPLLRYSDVLLMYAEAENELNNEPTTAAYDAVKLVRDRAYGNLLPDAVYNSAANIPSGLTQEEFREFIREERTKELCFEALRKYDLIRWGIFLPTMQEVAEHFDENAPAAWIWGALAFKNVEKKHLLFPIPIHDTSLHSDLGQNDGW